MLIDYSLKGFLHVFVKHAEDAQTHQTVHYTDVPLVHFQPLVHALANVVKTAEIGGAPDLPVTL